MRILLCTSCMTALLTVLLVDTSLDFAIHPQVPSACKKLPQILSLALPSPVAPLPSPRLLSPLGSGHRSFVAAAAACMAVAAALAKRSRVTAHIKARERMEKSDFDPKPPENVWRMVDGGILGDHDVCEMEDAKAVADLACRRVADALSEAIRWRGSASLALPGGSVMAMMGGLVEAVHGGKFAAVDWSKVHIAYVNHKCVALDDDRSNHHKAMQMFGSKLAMNVDQFVVPSGSSDGLAEAVAYQKKLLSLDSAILPKGADGIPQFDVLLLGVGTDGHVGSLYPDRSEVARADSYVLHVEQEGKPASITLSLPVINHAKDVIVVAVGENKAKALKTALTEDAGDAGKSCPAQAVHPKELSTWILDVPAASQLEPPGTDI
eukprot:CAMPEP_0172665172 /NCGR_PEP_ID=MMETSP1074-20121228/7078_1 /TAXON_ID=2916 /ORGANISM="Ceratium fusus, Strain PA161109" /LENGTH=378 /DNA_ID=CAMNT_0013481441 /DNA_START=55 /DNA_END=1191 /DNA_ORIENTATION=+